MRLRDSVRRLRLYYRSSDVFRERLSDPSLARWLPWMPAAREIDVKFRSGRVLRMPAGHWPLLPSACRLEAIGAEFAFLDDAKRVSIDGLTLYSPLWARNEASYYKEVLLDDAYGIKTRDLAGCTVVDVGAYVGDTSLAFARQGAAVHAIEPSASFCAFIRRNAQANGYASRITVHEVGFAARGEELELAEDRMRFVEGVSYAIANLPAAIDVLKLDCEGAEYHLLGDPRFLAHLAPREILLEYHQGTEGVTAPLEKAGYRVELHEPVGRYGLLSARSKRASC